MIKRLLITALLSGCLAGCTYFPGPRAGYNRHTGRAEGGESGSFKGYSEKGIVSYYGKEFHGKKTANGEIFDQRAMTAAHKTLPFNCRVKVLDLETGNSIVVRINDRGPFAKGRILDLSQGAASKLGMIEKGTAKAVIKVL